VLSMHWDSWDWEQYLFYPYMLYGIYFDQTAPLYLKQFFVRQYLKTIPIDHFVF